MIHCIHSLTLRWNNNPSSDVILVHLKRKKIETNSVSKENRRNCILILKWCGFNWYCGTLNNLWCWTSSLRNVFWTAPCKSKLTMGCWDQKSFLYTIMCINTRVHVLWKQLKTSNGGFLIILFIVLISRPVVTTFPVLSRLGCNCGYSPYSG